MAITPGSYIPQNLSQGERQELWDYFGHSGQAPVGYGGEGGGGGGVPSFSFDYEAEAQKAYGELGPYYDRILKESRGDLNLALARLSEDYERGARFKREDTGVARQALATQEERGKEDIVSNALARGLYQKSAFETPTQQAQPTGFGIPDVNLARLEQDIGVRKQGIETDLSRYLETTGVGKARKEFDLPEQQRRDEFEAEQRRRKEAGELSNLRGDRAYQKFVAGAGLT